MFITALLIICAILFIIAMLHLTDTAYTKPDCKKYQDHIDNLVTELFPPSNSAVQTPAVNTYTPTANDPDPQEDTVQEDTVQEVTVQEVTVQYQEAKRKMVANIRTYFNQRKINAVLAKIPGPDELAPVNPSAGTYEDRRSYDELSFSTPPSLQRILE